MAIFIKIHDVEKFKKIFGRHIFKETKESVVSLVLGKLSEWLRF